MPTLNIIMHICLFHINWSPKPAFEHSLFHLRLSQNCQVVSWLSYSMICYQFIYNNNNLSLTLPTTFSTTTLFLGYWWLQDSSSVTETWVSSSGMLPYLWHSIRKAYSLPAPSEYQSIHLDNTHTEAPMSPSSLTAMRFSLALTNRTLVQPQPFTTLQQTPFS